MSAVPDLGGPIRAALLADAEITGLIGLDAQGVPAIATRRPVPADFAAAGRFIIINPDGGTTNADALTSRRPIVYRSVAVYGPQGDPAGYRAVEQAGRALRRLFHRNRWAITVPDFHVIEITTVGPQPAPGDDISTIGRIVSLTISLQEV